MPHMLKLKLSMNLMMAMPLPQNFLVKHSMSTMLAKKQALLLLLNPRISRRVLCIGNILSHVSLDRSLLPHMLKLKLSMTLMMAMPLPQDLLAKHSMSAMLVGTQELLLLCPKL